jgi:capsular polysaccharide biosynthesis protein
MSTSAKVMDLFNIFSKTYTKEEAQKIVQDIEEIFDDRKNDLATKTDIKELELKIEQVKSSTIKWVVGWMVGLIIAQTAAITTIFLLLK